MNLVKNSESPPCIEGNDIESSSMNENGMTGNSSCGNNSEVSDAGVNLGALAGVSSSNKSSLLLVTSSISPNNAKEINRGRLPVNSSLAAAAKAGGINLRSSNPSNRTPPPTSVTISAPSQPSVPAQAQAQAQATVTAPVQAQTSAPGTSSLAAAAANINTQQEQNPPYQSSQMQTHHQYPGQVHYQSQHQHSYSGPHHQMQHPPTMHHPSHPSPHIHGHYHAHQPHPATATTYGAPSAFSDHVNVTKSISAPTLDAPSGSQYDVNESVATSGVDGDDDGSGAGDLNGPVKLFVGQVPKSMDEVDLTLAFQEYGEIKEILVIRDRHTGQHRGCAFVTFYNPADAALVQETLHDKFTFPEGRKPVQIKPASEPSSSMTPAVTPEQENKLFIGMTSRNADEDSIRELFSPYGEIREIYIIRNADGSNKGCAFLKYADNESALNAIEALNDNFTMEGATRPLIVKFADTKAQRKARSNAQARLLAEQRQHAGVHTPQTGYYPLAPHGHVPVYPNYQQPPPPMGMPPQYTQPPYSGSYPQGTPPPPHTYMYQPHSYAQPSPYGYPPPSAPYGPGQTPHTHTDGSPVPSSSASYEGSTGGSGPAIPTAPPHLVQTHLQSRSSLASRQQQSNIAMPRVQKPYHRQEITGAVNPRPREGPAGANLFIYHLPHDLTDADLATAFNPFGNVISAKVYVDKFTGESKGFGFVSYDSVISAEQAIEQMNGFQIGSKRLKVQHKRVSKPPTGQLKPSVNPDNPPVPNTIASMHPDSTAMMSTLSTQPPMQQQQYHPQDMNHQSLPSHLDVDGLAGDLQILDVGYQEDE